jgi:hypothetical protein
MATLLSLLLDDLGDDDAVAALYQVRPYSVPKVVWDTTIHARPIPWHTVSAVWRRAGRPAPPPLPLPLHYCVVRSRPHCTLPPTHVAPARSSRQVGPYVIQIKQRPTEGRVLDKELEHKQEQVGAGCSTLGGTQF